MTAPARPAPVHLVLGEEALLAERAVAAVVAQMRAAVGPEAAREMPVETLRAGEVSDVELVELLSPSLFAEDRVVVLKAAGEAGKEPAGLILQAAATPVEGVVLVIEHSGGGRQKTLAGKIEKLGVPVHRCDRIKGRRELLGFVREEFRAAGVRVTAEVAEMIVDAVGGDLRQLASTVSQLAADTGGKVDADAVRRYYSGFADVSGFDVADAVMERSGGEALETLRWALRRGVAHVLISDALAEGLHRIARVHGVQGVDPFRQARELGMAPFQAKRATAQARRWETAALATAISVAADLNAEVKGWSADSEYALERAVVRMVELRGR